jgi:hypothetical protein
VWVSYLGLLKFHATEFWEGRENFVNVFVHRTFFTSSLRSAASTRDGEKRNVLWPTFVNGSTPRLTSVRQVRIGMLLALLSSR